MGKTGAEGGLLGANSDLGVTFLVAIYKYTCAYTVPGIPYVRYTVHLCIVLALALRYWLAIRSKKSVEFSIYPSVAIFWLQKSVDLATLFEL